MGREESKRHFRQRVQRQAVALVKEGIPVAKENDGSGPVTLFKGDVIAGPVISDFNVSSSPASGVYDEGETVLGSTEQQRAVELFVNRDPILYTDQLQLQDNRRNTRRKSLPQSRQSTLHKIRNALRSRS